MSLFNRMANAEPSGNEVLTNALSWYAASSPRLCILRAYIRQNGLAAAIVAALDHAPSEWCSAEDEIAAEVWRYLFASIIRRYAISFNGGSRFSIAGDFTGYLHKRNQRERARIIRIERVISCGTRSFDEHGPAIWYDFGLLIVSVDASEPHLRRPWTHRRHEREYPRG